MKASLISVAIFSNLSAECLCIVTSTHTDKVPVSQNEEVKNQIRDLAKKMNEANSLY
jgi:hypothetical protein